MHDTAITLLNLSSKLLIYFGIAAVTGGALILLLCKKHSDLSQFIRRYISTGALLALSAVGINFFVQVAGFAEMGWQGMFDPDYIALLWDSPIGTNVMLRVIGLSVVLIAILLFRQHSKLPAGNRYSILFLISLGVGGILLATSFALIGHTAELTVLSRFVLGLHVLMALLWMGSLLPLWQACQMISTQPLQQLMHHFGVLAMGGVIILLAGGTILAYQLLGSLSDLVHTSYGLLLLTKLVLVDVMLAFAAWHKWRLVPQLNNHAAANRLQLSVMLESLAGLGILVATVMLSTLVGPESRH